MRRMSADRRAAAPGARSGHGPPIPNRPRCFRSFPFPLPPEFRTKVSEAREDHDTERRNAQGSETAASYPEELALGTLYTGERSECLWLCGQSGRWFRDRGYRYEGSRGLIGNGAEDGMISVRTKWRWADNSSCGMHRLSREGFCNLMELPGVGVSFVGEWISFMIANSLWWLLGEEGDFGSKLGYGYQEQEIRCAATDPGAAPYVFALVMARDDNLRALGEDDRHEDWTGRYLAGDARTIPIANTGAHTPPERYERDMDAFVETALGFDRPRDATIYRISVPGHTRCR